MLALAISPATPVRPLRWWPAGAVFAIDFAGGRGMSQGVNLPVASMFTVTRSTPKYAADRAGIFHAFAANQPALTDLGLSIEAEATNLCTWSNDISQSTWQKAGVSVAGGFDDPALDNQAWRVTEASATAAMSRTPIPITAGTTYTLTRILRRGNFDWIRLSIGDPSFSNAIYLWFNLSTTTLGSASNGGAGFGYVSRTISALGNGYHRLTATFVAPSGSVNVSVASASGNSVTTRADIGAGAGTGGQYYLWHSQIEIGNTSTPITAGNSASTRGSDTLSLVSAPFTGDVSVTLDDNTVQHCDAAALPSLFERMLVASLTI